MRKGILREAIAAFDAVVHLPLDERAPALCEVCGDDQELRRYVERLLARDAADTDSFLKPTVPTPPTASASLPSLSGYRIIRQLGEGGMGVVYEAEQEEPRRRVALKVIRGGAYVTEQQVRLFQREVESLARLNHPSIAAIHDAGRTPFGQHFFTMELVEGSSLSEFVGHDLPQSGSRLRESVRHRLGLFLGVCDAINYAHQRSVIHRDLKPSNILVVEEDSGSSRGSARARPRVKVLDFGLARITDADVSLTTMESEVGKIKGTLAYMSPEQARGDPNAIDVRTDIYSLGVILYELLTGKRPYDVQKPMIHEAVRVILEETPGRPSAIRRYIRGDLETIVLKALEKDPDRRYASVAALAEDIRRYQTGQPILARPPSTAYHFSKLVARHKVPFASVVTLMVLLTATTIVMSTLYVRAEREKTKASRTTEFIRSMLSQVDPNNAQGREVTVREVLDVAAKDIERDLADEPEVQAAVQSTIGNIYFNLSRNEEAEAMLQRSLQTRREVLGPNDPEIAETLMDIGALHYRINMGDAKGYFEEALHIAMTAPGENQLLVARAKMWLGVCTLGQDPGDEYLQEALEIRRRELGDDHPLTIEVISSLGRWHRRRGNIDEAIDLLRQGLEYHRRYADEKPWALQGSLNSLGVALHQKGDYAGARDLHEEEIALTVQILGYATFTPRVNLAAALHQLGEVDSAEVIYLDLLDELRSAGKDNRMLGRVLFKLGRIERNRGAPGLAEPYLREALEVRERKYPPGAWSVVETRVALGACLGELGRPEEGAVLLDEEFPALLGKIRAEPDSESSWWLDDALAFYESVGDQERLTELQEAARAHGHSGVAAN